MQRRKFVVGLGALASGSAAAVGTGAFTSVEATRDISVEVAGDQSALLAFDKATTGEDGSGSNTPNAQDYVTLPSDGELALDFTGSDEGATGLNDNASTKFSNLFDIINQGTQEVEVFVSPDQPGGIAFFAEGPDSNTGSNGNPNFPDPDNDGDQDQGAGFADDDPVILGVGERVENIGLRIETPEDLPSSGNTIEMTIVAQET
ncbi:hypothetical protein GLW36_09200 [Halorubrum terrestre]|uniref:DUF1102 domain-containing protein n=1 Tax=Halorubrum distributum TaxID=29283 RepID=A0A6B1ICD4_9EURY|nr:hypothetical protein [Halorubrum terrestre]MYL16819.1 hypothetical protein [Halorubrum terrestre]